LARLRRTFSDVEKKPISCNVDVSSRRKAAESNSVVTPRCCALRFVSGDRALRVDGEVVGVHWA